MKSENLDELAKRIRITSLQLCYQAKTSHIGGCLSVAEVLAVLYGRVLNLSPLRPREPERDRLFYSKGHASAAFYSALMHCGFIQNDFLMTQFARDGSYLTSHINHNIPGVEFSTGSLGHALGVACGCAVALKSKNRDSTVFAILSDGELDEGSNWESILFAQQRALDNLVVIIDYNQIQSYGFVEDVINLEPLADKFIAFNWEVIQVDGHDTIALHDSLAKFRTSRAGTPKCVIARTVKGKGVDFMENKLEWHYKSPSIDELHSAIHQLGGV